VPAPQPQKALSLGDFADFLAALATEGVEVIVIGGCAVGAYADLVGETVFSGDLDVLVSREALEVVLYAATKAGALVHKRPQPRSVPVAVLDWHGKDVNVLMAAAALAPAEVEARLAREFHLRGSPGAPVLVVDPYHLLRDKLACNRPKDQPHIEILRRFLEEEAVHAFETETDPRQRLASPRRLMEVLRSDMLPEPLARRLIPIARIGSDFRFLIHRVPDHLQATVVARAEQVGMASELPTTKPRHRSKSRRKRRTASRRSR
jgi:hypothetical protein